MTETLSYWQRTSEWEHHCRTAEYFAQTPDIRLKYTRYVNNLVVEKDVELLLSEEEAIALLQYRDQLGTDLCSLATTILVNRRVRKINMLCDGA